MSATERLTELGIEWPAVPTPLGSYVPAVRIGDLVYTSGQTPLVNGQLMYAGAVGDGTVTIEDAKASARLCGLNALAAASGACGGVDDIVRIVKVTVFVASTPDFTRQPEVANGASDLFTDIFGDDGKHARSAIGVSSLPLGCTTEVEIIVQVRP
ncbi:MAG: RidA family protein [Propionibacteriaceae bacterium]|nr:RidA family protein [Propionibacteriaceae bacterium]